MTMENVADEIEQYMFERGEYDYIDTDRVRWLHHVPENLAPETSSTAPTFSETREALNIFLENLNDARETVCNNIKNSMDTVSGIQALIEYFNDELAELDEEDELVEKAETIMEKICSEWEEKLTTIFQDYLRLENCELIKSDNGYHLARVDGNHLGETEDKSFRNAVEILETHSFFTQDILNSLENAWKTYDFPMQDMPENLKQWSQLLDTFSEFNDTVQASELAFRKENLTELKIADVIEEYLGAVNLDAVYEKNHEKSKIITNERV